MTTSDEFIDLASLAEREDPLQMVAPPSSRISSRPIPITTPTQAAVGIQSIREARRKGDHRPTFKLESTGGTALVKRPSMLSLANSGALPNHLRPIIEAITVRAIREPSPDVAAEIDQFGLTDMVELVDATCIEGFMNPRLVPTDHMKSPSGEVKAFPKRAEDFIPLEEEGYVRCNRGGQVYPPEVMYVDEIDIDDRGAFFAWCNTVRQEDAKAVAPFPENGQQPVPAAQGRRVVPR